MGLYSWLRYRMFKKKKVILAPDDLLEIEKPITFDQAFFLYNLYQWLQKKEEDTVIEMHLNAVIAINYFDLKKRFNLPGKSFDDFCDRAGVLYSHNLGKMYKIKEEEGLISESDLEYNLTEKGRRVVQIIKLRHCHKYGFFDDSVKRFFSPDLIDSLDRNIDKIKDFTDNGLFSTSLYLIKQ